MNNFYSKFMSVIHHGPIQLMNIISLFKYIEAKETLQDFDIKQLEEYQHKIKCFEGIETPFELLDFCKNLLKYKNDGYKGLLQHYNTELEVFVLGLDCEDYARFIKYYLKKKFNIDVVWFGVLGNKIKTWHYDCYFIYEDVLYIANQGNYKRLFDYTRFKFHSEKCKYENIKQYIISYIKSDKYMNGWYKNLKAFWICKW